MNVDRLAVNPTGAGYAFATSDFGFTDVDGNSLNAVKITTLPAAGTLTDDGVAVAVGQLVSVADITSGKLVFTPASGASGTGYASFTFQVQDDGGTANGGVDLDPTANTITVDVSAANGAPVAADDSFTGAHSTQTTITVLTNDTDPDNDSLTITEINGTPISVGTGPNTGIAITNGWINLNSSGRLVFTPTNSAANSFSFTYTISDGNGGTATGTVTGTIPDSAPQVALSASNLISNGAFDGGSNTDWTGNSGPVEVNPSTAYGVSTDGSGTSDGYVMEVESAAMSPDTNEAWVETTISTVVGQTYVYSVRTHSRDNENTGDMGYISVNDAQVARIVSDDTWQTVSATFTATSTTTTIRITSTGSLAGWAPQPGDGGSMLVDDVTVVPVDYSTTFTENGAPVAIASSTSSITDIDSATIASGLIALTNPQSGDQLLVGGSSAASGTINGIGYTNTGSVVTLTGSATQADYDAAIAAITFSNTSDSPSTADRIINVTVNDGALSSNTAVTTIHVIPVNDAPAGADKTVTTLEDTAYTFAAADFGFSDVDGNTLNAVKITTLPAGGTLTDNGIAVTAGQLVSVADFTSGKLVWTPAGNATGNGLASFTFQVQDNGGTTNGGVDTDPTSNIITFNVTPENDAPLAVTDTFTMQANSSTVISPLGNDTDVDNGSWQLSITEINGQAIAIGQSVAVANGTSH